jgi:hypothetical protein
MKSETGSITSLVLYNSQKHLDAPFQILTNLSLLLMRTQITSVKVLVIATGAMVSSVGVVSFRFSGRRQRMVRMARSMRIWSRGLLLPTGVGTAVATAYLFALLWIRNNSSLCSLCLFWFQKIVYILNFEVSITDGISALCGFFCISSFQKLYGYL